MNTKKLILIGAGGHAKVVLDTALLLFPDWEIECQDDDPKKAGKNILGIPIHSLLTESNGQVHVAIGDNFARRHKVQEALQMGMALNTLVHPSASLARGLLIGEACFIAARAVIGPETKMGRACIINHGAIVDHDNEISDYCHVAPNATLGGGVKLGEQVLVGAGATILPGVQVGDGAIIGAGAVVTKNIQPGVTVVGVPGVVRKK